MTQLDPFPDEQNRIVLDLERRIEALEAAVKSRPAAAVTRASGPFFLPDATVTLQSGGLTIGAAGGQFQVVDQIGNRVSIPVGYVATITATNAGATYDSAAQILINTLKTAVNDLTFSLKSDHVMKTS